jgi:hypothetical protein
MAGEKRRRKERFLADHQFCCFCGGDEVATDIDHQPLRALFSERKWPLGFEFPACSSCNTRTRHSELVVAFYAQAADPRHERHSAAQFRKLVDGIANNVPEALPILDLPANQKRKILREHGMDLPIGTTTLDIPAVEIPKAFRPALLRFAAKLFCALYYKELGMIFPRNGAISCFFTLTRKLDDEAMSRVLKPAPNLRRTARSGRDLTEQFCYRFGGREDGRVFVVVAHLREGFMLVLTGVTDRSDMTAVHDWNWVDLFGGEIPRSLDVRAAS